MDQATRHRYARQLSLKAIGEKGQKKLFDASALVAGCGALGSTQAQLLVRAGVGRLRVVDRDRPESSNLPRQLLYDEDDLAAGIPKAEVAAARLSRMNSTARVEGKVLDIRKENIIDLVADVDVVLDATDNFETRYLLNDACVKLNKAWIYGGIIGTSGMTMTIRPGQTACLRCLFPRPPDAVGLPTPESEGILNSAPAVVGAIQATEAIKLLTGAGGPTGSLLLIDLWPGSFRQVPVVRDQKCPCCRERRFEFLEG